MQASAPQAFEIDIKGHHEAGSSPQIKHKLESDSPSKQLTKEQIDENLRNAEENRNKILEIRKERAGQDGERVEERVKEVESSNSEKQKELEQKIKDDQKKAEEKREAQLEEIRSKNRAEVEHAKEVAAKAKTPEK
eukprot:TRINITY_DN22838_c0_g1_i1.p1 TRINITY_DN22838_c0_g1~~TRINITY_DN22838_c0_g1_i1.p1  ORF type:complete len:136 (-),score=71.10 TRINITY_DN22838_c0_g1_i1:91-498(-)